MTTKRTLTQADVNLLKETFATKNDMDRLENKFDQKLDDNVQKFETLVTGFKNDFYTKIDPILKEVVASREDRTIGAEQHRRNQDRIEKLEKIHPNGRHLAAI